MPPLTTGGFGGCISPDGHYADCELHEHHYIIISNYTFQLKFRKLRGAIPGLKRRNKKHYLTKTF